MHWRRWDRAGHAGRSGMRCGQIDHGAQIQERRAATLEPKRRGIHVAMATTPPDRPASAPAAPIRPTQDTTGRGRSTMRASAAVSCTAASTGPMPVISAGCARVQGGAVRGAAMTDGTGRSGKKRHQVGSWAVRTCQRDFAPGVARPRRRRVKRRMAPGHGAAAHVAGALRRQDRGTPWARSAIFTASASRPKGRRGHDRRADAACCRRWTAC